MVNTVNATIVKDTFNKEYNEDDFKIFISELLPNADLSSEIEHRIQLPQTYNDFIRSAKRIAKYNYISQEYNEEKILDVLVVKLKKATSIDRARTAQRNFIARYLNGSRSYQKDAALVAFISEDENGNISPDWRFSLIQMNYVTEIIEDANGKKKRKTSVELTPAKRFSFLVGANEDTHTAQKQFFTCLEKSSKGEPITIEDLVLAFDIEKVSKEFFDKYKNLYQKLVTELQKLKDTDKEVFEDFNKHNINLDDFAKKTLGQLVFLYFIQKKGWLGVKKDENWGQGDKKFLRNLFNKKYCEYNNFFNDVLEHLFYEALATDRGVGAWFDKLNCRIPFLNGGLFEPVNGYEYERTNLTIDNDLFKEIFDTFDLYNFTVKEDEPLEKEVAIDPEMLGKVFENLLPENIQKGNGAFYTRREIVHYMCQESLINYLYNKINIKQVPLTTEEKEQQLKLLKTKKEKEQLKLTQEVLEEIISKDDINYLIKKGDSIYSNKDVNAELPESIKKNAKIIDDALNHIKVCDPAIGSGAFPVGMMNEIVRARAALNDVLNTPDRPTYELKRNAIENSIYGVDIDPGAVEIAKLRFWLSLVVDEEDLKNIRPLPNLDYKIMQGNSLITCYEGVDFDKIIDEYKPNTQLKINLWGNRESDLKKELKDLQTKFFKSSHPTEKTDLKEEIEEKIIDLVKNKFEEQAKLKGKPKDFYEEKIRNFAQNRESRNFFPWKLFFADAFEQGGFDIVIGNPPYLGEAKNGDNLKQLAGMKYYQGKMNIWYYFTCFGLDILKQNGILNFIAPNNWNTAAGSSIMRNKILEETKIIDYKDFGNYHAFESADQQTMIMLLWKNTICNEHYELRYSRVLDDNITIPQLELFLESNLEEPYAIIYNTIITKEDLINKFITFNNCEDEKIFSKIADSKMFLHENEIAQGIVAPQDFINNKCAKNSENKFKVGECVFALTNEYLNKLNITATEKNIIKPLYNSSEIDRYYTNNNNQNWIIYTTSKFKDINEMNNYPNLKKHLDRYNEVITSDNKPYGLHRARDEKFFKGEKILSLRKCSRPSFSFVEFDCYVLQTFFIIKTDRLNLKYLTGILNSKLVAFWLKHKGKMQGNNYQIDKEPLMNIPIYKPTKAESIILEQIVENILKITTTNDYLKNTEKQQAVKEYENQIDILLYKLYDLTYDEVLVIDKAFSLSEEQYNNYNI